MNKKTIKKTKGKIMPVSSSFFSARLSSIIAIILLLGTIGVLYAKNQELERKPEKDNRPPVSQSTPTLEPAAKGEQTIPTPDPNPIVNCSIHADCGGGSKQMRLSECNQMTCCTIHEKCGGGARFITKTECDNLYCCSLKDGTSKLMTKNECDAYYSASGNIVSGNNTSTLPTYPPCTIYYPNLNHAETYYYLSPEQCQKSKESLIIPVSSPTPIPTYQPSLPPIQTEDQLQITAGQIEQDIKHCKNEVHAYYNQQVRNCSIQFGGSSAEEACIYAQNKERDKKLKECEQKF